MKMTKYLSVDQSKLKQLKAYWTAKEIQQQPQSWSETVDSIENNRNELNAFLQPILALKDLRIVFTGAGTSAYVGDAIVPHIRKETGLRAVSISTTDIVGTPHTSLHPNSPTLLVSFGRSGSSPESVAAVELADKMVNQCFHLIVTCNAEGHLAVASKHKANAFTLLMPEQTLDQSFAMTSSFTSMLVAALSVFTPVNNELANIIECTDNILNSGIAEIQSLAENSANRVVFLGAGSLAAIAKEAALKCLELTAGKNMSYFETPLGFRHGPKSLINNETVVFIFPSYQEYTKAYDQDLIAELESDDVAQNVVSIELEKFGLKQPIPDVWAGLPYIVVAQLFSFYQSLKFNLSPDNPCPSGEVNRVVEGVTIHELI